MCKTGHASVLYVDLFPIYSALLYSKVSFSWKTRARTSILSLPSLFSVPGTWNAVWGTRRALPSSFESKHLINSTSSGVSPDL